MTAWRPAARFGDDWFVPALWRGVVLGAFALWAVHAANGAGE